jgi:hypothetical protein
MLSQSQALLLARSGHLQEAEIMWSRAAELAEQTGHRARALLYEISTAVCEANLGNLPASRRRAHGLLKLATSRDAEYAEAYVLARTGDLSGSQKLADDLDKRFPEDTPVQFEYLPTLTGPLRTRSPRPRHGNQ